MTAADEQRLILQVQEGSHEAFRILVQRYMKQAYNVAYGLVGDHDDAEDVAQESFVRIFQSIGGFRGDAVFGTWLYRIVTNLSLNRMRQKKSIARREIRTNGEVMTEMNHSTPDYHREETSGVIERVLHDLPTLQRAVVILRHLNGMSTKEVGSILHCSEGTVKTHLHRGLKKMRKSMDLIRDEL